MTPEKLDFIFPFIVFGYGVIMVFVLESPAMVRLGEQRLGQVFQNMKQHRHLAWICFFVGGLWSAQNIWFSSLS